MHYWFPGVSLTHGGTSVIVKSSDGALILKKADRDSSAAAKNEENKNKLKNKGEM